MADGIWPRTESEQFCTISYRPSTIRSYLRALFAWVNGSSRMNGCQAAGGWVGEIVRAVGDQFRPPSCGEEARMAGQLAWSLCSRNAQPRKALVRRAQWRPHQPPRQESIGGSIRSGNWIGFARNGTPPPRHAPHTAQHRGRFAPALGETARIRLGCLQSTGWRDASRL